MIISETDLASYLRDDTLAINPALVLIVGLVNELVEDNWATPLTPVPARVKLLALNVAARAWAWNPASAHLETITRSVDDASRTERYRTGSSSGSVYLTSDELLQLRGKPKVRSVRLVSYGDK